jgi:predicted P-loop ATPase
MNTIDFKQLSYQLLSKAESILIDICPGGKRNGKEYEAAEPGGGQGKSFKFNLETGIWKDFATGKGGGDIISLYAHNYATTQIEAAKILQETYVNNSKEPVKVSQSKPPKPQSKTIPPPKDIAPPDFTHYKLGEPSMVHPYKDQEGNILYYVCRYEIINDNGEPDKEHRPISFTDNNKWEWKAWPNNRPLYGLEKLASNKKILIVEGEKAADSATRWLPAYSVISWQGGVKALNQTDWSPLKDKDVLLWPDADNPGIVCMQELSEILFEDVKTLKVLNTDREGGWDAADAEKESWTQSTFLEWARPIAQTLKDPTNKEVEIVNERKKKVEQILQNYPHKEVTKNNIIVLSTIDNLQHLLNAYGIIVRNNLLTKREEILIPNESFHDENKENAQLAYIKSIAGIHSMPITQIEEFMKYLANKNQYNPVVTWIKSKPWDQTERLKDFYNTITAINEDTDPKVKWIKETFIKRWMLSAVAAAFEPQGVSAHGALVFQGKQGSGKTYWFKRLVPKESKFAKDGVTLKTDDKDSIMQALSFWLVELGEVDATFRKSDISSLKGFITKDSDTFRAPFARRESTYARRTVFFASVNPRQFLHDETGNRRFWTIECKDINYKHTFDMQQVWAEVYELYKSGEPWVLQPDEDAYLEGHNEDYQALDPIEELISERLDWELLPHTWEEKTSTEILIECGINRPTKGELNKAAVIIKKLNGGVTNRSKKGRYLAVPRLKLKYQKNGDFGF